MQLTYQGPHDAVEIELGDAVFTAQRGETIMIPPESAPDQRVLADLTAAGWVVKGRGKPPAPANDDEEEED